MRFMLSSVAFVICPARHTTNYSLCDMECNYDHTYVLINFTIFRAFALFFKHMWYIYNVVGVLFDCVHCFNLYPPVRETLVVLKIMSTTVVLLLHIICCLFVDIFSTNSDTYSYNWVICKSNAITCRTFPQKSVLMLAPCHMASCIMKYGVGWSSTANKLFHIIVTIYETLII